MPLVNIIDYRKRKYRWKKINAVFEAAWHDNSCKDSDREDSYSRINDGPDCDVKKGISLQEAILWARGYKNPVTLFLYDEDNDPMGSSIETYPNRKNRKLV